MNGGEDGVLGSERRAHAGKWAGNKFYYILAYTETEKEQKQGGNKHIYIPKLSTGECL